MALQVLFTCVAALVIIICISYLAGRNRPVPEPAKVGIEDHSSHLNTPSDDNIIVFSDPASCRQILACKDYSSTKAPNLYSEVKSRAIPNKRLTDVFGIDNSFTTMEEKRRKDFNSDAGKAIKMTEAKWQVVVNHAKELVGQAIPASHPATVGQSASVTLDSLVRSVCLKIILHVLFEMEPLELDNESIMTITESINTLWIKSKPKAEKGPSEVDKSTLHNALKVFFPEHNPKDHRKSSLNLIIPSYETLWRVVLSGFLQVTFVEGASPAWTSALEQFLDHPTIAARNELVPEEEGSPVSVDHLVKETLRLYPSVKRVFRQLNMKGKSGPENVAADVEACQRNQALWGANAQCFVPSRWNNANEDAQNSYMAFGRSPFLCPAKGEFGPMMIGILVAAFAHHVSSKDWYLELSEGSPKAVQDRLNKALSGKEPLASDRSTYEGIKIVRK